MEIVHILDLPKAKNVCDQSLREIPQTQNGQIFSAAHVQMQGFDTSLLHEHHMTNEIYVITRGLGLLTRENRVFRVSAGDAIGIPKNARHKLVNLGKGDLEHLVIAMPPFQPDDVHTDVPAALFTENAERFMCPPWKNAFDGARIMEYSFGGELSIAYGTTVGKSALVRGKKSAHFHKLTHEYMFVVNGQGRIEINGTCHKIERGNWIHILPYEYHLLLNDSLSPLDVVCVCTPTFMQDDVYYH